MLGRATITLGIDPHSNVFLTNTVTSWHSFYTNLWQQHTHQSLHQSGASHRPTANSHLSVLIHQLHAADSLSEEQNRPPSGRPNSHVIVSATFSPHVALKNSQRDNIRKAEIKPRPLSKFSKLHHIHSQNLRSYNLVSSPLYNKISVWNHWLICFTFCCCDNIAESIMLII